MMLPFPSWTPDRSAQSGGSQIVQNVLPRADGYGPMKSIQALTSALTGGNDTYTKVLLHGDGTDASTTITDSNSGGSSHTWTAAGNAQIDTAQSKFGGASILFDGTGDRVSTADHADFTLGASDFTIDFWLRPAALATQYEVCGQIDSAAVGNANSAWRIFINATTSFPQFQIVSGTTITSVTAAVAVVVNTWVHIAVVRTGNTLRMFMDGVQTGGDVSFSSTVNDSTGNLVVGRSGDLTSPGSDFSGWIDEFRLSVGVARWIVAFTPSTAAYDSNAACRGFFYARNTDGTITAFAGTATKLFKLNNSSLVWEDVSAAAGYAALPASYQWQFAQFGSIVIAVKPSTNPQAFTLASSTVFADLAGSPPQAAYIAIVGRFVVLAGLTSTPFTIAWSALGSAIGWTPGTASSDTQALPDGGIVRGVAGGEYGVIFQETTMRRIIYAPGSTTIFTIEKIADDKGLLAPYSLTRAGDRIFFLSPQGYCMMTPTGSPEPIGKEMFDRFLFDNYDPNNLQYVIGASDPQSTRVYLTYKSASSSNSYFDRILVYDYALQRAAVLVVNGEYLASLAAPGITMENLDNVSSSIDALTVSLDDISTAAFSKLSVADTSHQIGFFSGSNLEATIDTSEQGGERRFRVKGFRPVTDAATCYGSVGARETAQATLTYSTEQAVNSKGLCPANISTRLARGRLRIPAAATWTFASGINPEFAVEGKR